MFSVAINGISCQIAEGGSILEVLRSRNIEVPTLCYDERLAPFGGCRLCIVGVEGFARPVAACTTPIRDGMVIKTHTKELESLRKTLLRLLAKDYPAPPLADFPDKQLHRYLSDYGLEDEVCGKRNQSMVDDSHPYIHVDMSQCIYCYRCVRICEEVQGQFVWHAWNRGDATRILPDSGGSLKESACVSCGACVDTCPTGALEDNSILKRGVPSAWTRTTCPYCGTGCEMDAGIRDNRIVSMKPALHSAVSKGHLCVKGRYAFDFVYAGDRATAPMLRDGGKWKEVSWDQAISFAAGELRRMSALYGPDSIGVLGSARATNEENYLAQKFARVALGTNNVDCCARVCHAPTAAAMKATLGTGAATNSFDDIERAGAILICGANPTENHPIVGARIKQAALAGTPLIVIDPRLIELARYADCHLRLKPGTNIPLLNAMTSVIVEEQLYDEAFLRERVSEFEEFRQFMQQWKLDRVAATCGVDAQLIRRAARLYAGSKSAMSIHGLGTTEHVQGTDGVMCLVNLALLTGNLGKPGAGVNPLRGQNNVQGSAHMGCDPSVLTGSVPIEAGRSLFETVWSARIPANRGLNLMQMMDAAESGRLKALWAIGYDIFLTNANAHATRRALAGLEFVLIQDMFLNETAREFGTVFLPAASSFEKDGTFMNAERRVQRVRKIIEPVGNSKSDWEIICLLAQALGKGEFFNFDSPEAVWNEIRSVWKGGSGISYARLEPDHPQAIQSYPSLPLGHSKDYHGTRGGSTTPAGYSKEGWLTPASGGLQWPCDSEDHPGTPILHVGTFSGFTRAALRRIDYKPTEEEQTNSEFPFLLITGRTLYQFNAGTMTLRTANVEFRPTDYLDISAEDASELGIVNGDCVRLRSRYGESVMPARISASVRRDELFATFHTSDVFLNNVTGPYRDASVDAPEYKITAVQIVAGEPGWMPHAQR